MGKSLAKKTDKEVIIYRPTCENRYDFVHFMCGAYVKEGRICSDVSEKDCASHYKRRRLGVRTPLEDPRQSSQ